MADSENSRTLPAITCGNLLLITQGLLEEKIRSTEISDRSLSGWNTWLDASRETARLNQQQQDLEGQIFTLRRIGPEASSRSNGIVGAFTAHDCLDEKASSVVKAKPDDAARPKSSNDGELQARHSYAREAELRASDVEDDLSDALFSTRADTLLGSVAKLHCLLKREQPSHESEEHPWPEIRSVLTDLLMLIDAERWSSDSVGLSTEAKVPSETGG
jgi:hypothetical protein